MHGMMRLEPKRLESIHSLLHGPLLMASLSASWLLAPLGAELGDPQSGDGESALLSASDERAWLRDRGCIGDGSLTVRREAVCRRCGGGGGGRRRRCSLAGGGAAGGDLGADEGRRPRNRVAGDLDLEGLELTDSVAGTGIAARVRALARPSKTTPRPWVYEAGAHEGLEI